MGRKRRRRNSQNTYANQNQQCQQSCDDDYEDDDYNDDEDCGFGCKLGRAAGNTLMKMGQVAFLMTLFDGE